MATATYAAENVAVAKLVAERVDEAMTRIAAEPRVSLGYAEPKDDLIVEYDQDVLRTFGHESATDRGDEFAEWVP
jgi:hypothetical protein